MDIRIDIDSTSTEATAARRQMLSPIAAHTGGGSAYLPMLGELANALVATSDPVVLAQRVANFMDSAADAVDKRLSEGEFT